MQNKLQELEAKVQELEQRVRSLENAKDLPNTFAWPVKEVGVYMGVINPITTQIQPDASWPFPVGTKPDAQLN